jgi:MFS family permease
MKSKPTNKGLITILAPGLIVFSMGQTVLFAIAGPVFREIGLGEFQLGIIISSAAMVFVVSSGVWGQISDRWGRRPVIVFGLSTYGFISLAFATVMGLGLNKEIIASTVFVGLLILRLLYAALGAGIQPAAVALMADHSTESERSSAVAMVSAAFGIGMVLGPASAALTVGFGILTPLFVIAVLGLLSAVLAHRYLPENKQKDTIPSAQADPLPLASLTLLLVATLLLYSTMSSIQQTLAFNLQDLLGTTSTETVKMTGFCFMAIAAATLLMQAFVIQKLQPRPSTLLLAGLPLIIAALLVYVTADSFAQLIVASATFGCGFGLVTPGIMSSASLLSRSDEQGKVAGIVQAAMAAGFVVGPTTATYLYESDRLYASMFALAGAVGACILVICWLVQNRRSLKEKQ